MVVKMKVDLKQAVDFFKTNDNFTLICHANPDGDTLGSGYGLCGVLHIMGKRARVICDDEVSPRFDFLPEAIDKSKVELIEGQNETAVTVDVADIELIGSLKDKYPEIDFCIDHHISNKYYAAKTLIDTNAAACAEVVWALIKGLGVEVTPAISSAIYTGVSTDTGCFTYSNTTVDSHLIAAELMVSGFNVAKINYLMFEMKTRERIKLETSALDGIEYFFDDRCAVITLTADMLNGIDPEDASNISVLPKQIQGVEVGVVIKEKIKEKLPKIIGEKTWKISIRTSENVNAQTICASLGGGGHIRAAGCSLKGSVDAVKHAVLNQIEKSLN
ncbi:MAG: bifunctional oligoribonuclease/PAP phosphatase NrnA [Oscillospiraceae bacterium]|nr:bifunctional oligoribonuclease/PAP phosphatase NrnA [Oscillospiraceae bacterium]